MNNLKTFEEFNDVNEGFGKKAIAAGLLSLALAGSGKGQEISKMHPFEVVKLTSSKKEKIHVPKKPNTSKTATPYKRPDGAEQTPHKHKPKPKKSNAVEFGVVTKRDSDNDKTYITPLKPKPFTTITTGKIKAPKIKKRERTKIEQEKFMRRLCKEAGKINRSNRKLSKGRGVVGCLSSPAAKYKENKRQADLRRNRDPH